MESLVLCHILWPEWNGLDLWFISLGLQTFNNSQGNGQGATQSCYSRKEAKLEANGNKSTGSAHTIQEEGYSVCPEQGKAGGCSDRLR